MFYSFLHRIRDGGHQSHFRRAGVETGVLDDDRSVRFHKDGVRGVARDRFSGRVAQLVHADVMRAHRRALGGEIGAGVPVLEEEGELDFRVHVRGVDDADRFVGNTAVFRDGIEIGVGNEPGFLAVCFHVGSPFCVM